jgi:hypothetical protein
MTEDKVLAALDAFIAGFDPSAPEPKDPRGHIHKGETLVNRDSQKKREEREEREEERSSRVESSYIEKCGSFCSDPQKAEDSRASQRGYMAENVASLVAPNLKNLRIHAPLSGPTREMRWHLDHGERVPHDLCAGCRRPIAPGQETLNLADGNRVHLADGYDCLIRHGTRWRAAAPRAAVPET